MYFVVKFYFLLKINFKVNFETNYLPFLMIKIEALYRFQPKFPDKPTFENGVSRFSLKSSFKSWFLCRENLALQNMHR